MFVVHLSSAKWEAFVVERRSCDALENVSRAGAHEGQHRVAASDVSEGGGGREVAGDPGCIMCGLTRWTNDNVPEKMIPL